MVSLGLSTYSVFFYLLEVMRLSFHDYPHYPTPLSPFPRPSSISLKCLPECGNSFSSASCSLSEHILSGIPYHHTGYRPCNLSIMRVLSWKPILNFRLLFYFFPDQTSPKICHFGVNSSMSTLHHIALWAKLAVFWYSPTGPQNLVGYLILHTN